MAGKKFWLGILVLALVFGMTVVGCDSGTGGGGGGGVGGGSGNELWEKLMAGSATWNKDGSSLTMVFSAPQENQQSGSCKLSVQANVPGMPGSVYVKLNRASFPWYGNITSPYNITIGGGSSDAGTLSFSSENSMSISNMSSAFSVQFNGSYTRAP
jgi:hypothetical protein